MLEQTRELRRNQRGVAGGGSIHSARPLDELDGVEVPGREHHRLGLGGD